MNEIQGTVLSINAGTTKTGKTYWDVAFSDGQRYRAWDNALAQAANALIGQQATLGVDITQNGQYTNYNLRTVNAANGVLPGAPAPLPLAPATSPPSRGGRDPEVEARIVRQSSMATAFNFVGHILSGSGDIAEAKETALALAKELFGHAFHGGNADKVQAPSEVAQQVNTVLGTDAVAVGATPEATKDW